jgi:large subunit ribosomal protein L7/L12
MANKVEEIIEQLKSLTLLEAAELVKSIEDTFDVSAASGGGGGMMMATGPSMAVEVEEKTEFDLVLEEVPADKNWFRSKRGKGSSRISS